MGFDDMDFDEFVENLKENCEEYEPGVYMVDPSVVWRMGSVLDTLKCMQEGTKNKVVSNMSEMDFSTGVIKVFGEEFVCKDPAMFFRVARLCTNFEVVPTTDGSVRVTFLFDNLAKHIGDNGGDEIE